MWTFLRKYVRFRLAHRRTEFLVEAKSPPDLISEFLRSDLKNLVPRSDLEKSNRGEASPSRFNLAIFVRVLEGGEEL